MGFYTIFPEGAKNWQLMDPHDVVVFLGTTHTGATRLHHYWRWVNIYKGGRGGWGDGGWIGSNFLENLVMNCDSYEQNSSYPP